MALILLSKDPRYEPFQSKSIANPSKDLTYRSPDNGRCSGESDLQKEQEFLESSQYCYNSSPTSNHASRSSVAVVNHKEAGIQEARIARQEESESSCLDLDDSCKDSNKTILAGLFKSYSARTFRWRVRCQNSFFWSKVWDQGIRIARNICERKALSCKRLEEVSV